MFGLTAVASTTSRAVGSLSPGSNRPSRSARLVCWTIWTYVAMPLRRSMRYSSTTAPPFRTPSHALGQLIDVHHAGEAFTLTGTDYPTSDGTGIRDYIHVWDLAAAHVAAVTRFEEVTRTDPYRGINLGTGRGTTVRELVTAFEAVTGTPLATVTTEARPGDSAGAYARVGLALELLGWKAERSLEDGIRDSLRWYAQRARSSAPPTDHARAGPPRRGPRSPARRRNGRGLVVVHQPRPVRAPPPQRTAPRPGPVDHGLVREMHQPGRQYDAGHP